MTSQLITQKFSEARLLEPCVIFFEEFECLASARHGDVLNDPLISQLTISLDYIRSNENIFVIAATNRPDLIEPALLRPGRIDQLIYIPLPNLSARLAILQTALRKTSVAHEVDLELIAKLTRGLSGADLVEICQRACMFCVRDIIAANRTKKQERAKQEIEQIVVSKKHFESAMKSARRSVSEQDVYRFDNFNKILTQISSPNFQFPKPENGEPQIANNEHFNHNPNN